MAAAADIIMLLSDGETGEPAPAPRAPGAQGAAVTHTLGKKRAGPGATRATERAPSQVCGDSCMPSRLPRAQRRAA